MPTKSCQANGLPDGFLLSLRLTLCRWSLPGVLLFVFQFGLGCHWFAKPDKAQQDEAAQTEPGSSGKQTDGENVSAAKDGVQPGTEERADETHPGKDERASQSSGTPKEGTLTAEGQRPVTIGGVVAPADAGDPFMQAVENIKAGPSNYPAALRNLDASITQNPRLAEAYFNKGVIYQELNDTEQATRAYRKALEIKPTLSEAAANLATLYVKGNEPAKALEVIDAALKVSPGNALLRNNRALALDQMGRTDEAIGEIREILKINAINVNAFINLGCIYLKKSDYEMGRLVFEKALLSVPDAKEDPYVHHNLGVAFLGLKDNRAAHEFDLALSFKPDLVPSLINRAYLHLEIQESEEAAELLRRAVAEQPSNVTVRINLGVALRGMNEYDRAALQYEEALKLEPRNATALLDYAILLDDYQKEYLKAVDVYERLKEVTPSPEEVEKIDKYIRVAKNNQAREERRKKSRANKPKEEPNPTNETPARPQDRGAAEGTPDVPPTPPENPGSSPEEGSGAEEMQDTTTPSPTEGERLPDGDDSSPEGEGGENPPE